MSNKYLVVYSESLNGSHLKWFKADNIIDIKYHIIKNGYNNIDYIKDFIKYHRLDVDLNDFLENNPDYIEDYFKFVSTPTEGVQRGIPGKEWWSIKIILMDSIKYIDITGGNGGNDTEVNKLIEQIKKNIKS